MNNENRWVKKADLISWNEIQERFAKLFPTLIRAILQSYYELLWDLCLSKNSITILTVSWLSKLNKIVYYQHFISLFRYQYEQAYVTSLLVEFRKYLVDYSLLFMKMVVQKRGHTESGFLLCALKHFISARYGDLVDKIYRNLKNIAYFKEYEIRIFDPALERSKEDLFVDKQQKY